MKITSLRTRFIVAGCLLLALTVACGIWSVLTFNRLGTALVKTLDENQKTIDLAVAVLYVLEREDEILLRALNGGRETHLNELQAQRATFEKLYRQLQSHVRSADDEQAFIALRSEADAFRQAADSLLAQPKEAHLLEAYATRVHPPFRRAITHVRHFREANVDAMEMAGVEIEKDAHQS